MHALLSFSANHLAWVSSSPETRNIHIYHGSIAMRGLHEAIGDFSQANSDAILAASLLMLWQATDWRSWSSLRSGVQSVLGAMQGWEQQSLFADLISEEDPTANSFRSHRRRSSADGAARAALLQEVTQALDILRIFIAGHEPETHWVAQLQDYIQRLQACEPARTPEEQFSHMYMLRKWLNLVPISLLRRPGGKGPAMLALAHFYATALTLEPLFPDLGASFCSATALQPLEAIISVTTAMSSTLGVLEATQQEIATTMHFPQQAAFTYRLQALQKQQTVSSSGAGMPFSVPPTPESMSYGNLSPAFAAATPRHFASPSRTNSGSASGTPFLEVPVLASQPAGFGYGTSSWGAMPSPAFTPTHYTMNDGQGYDTGIGGFNLGAVPSGSGCVFPSMMSVLV
ncbi:hypothetical protein B0A48_10016 [Cryoendolithus antarcticus]|uniref:Transcription factor domain-containing protein n=1 Tax=Cryoendolithus antarcticus TaxID=1507870 RepID=A0A1V8T3K7_9PEZI|nr:hypothetical protein B0A48_10016 [Cryoendolithus antarcticus]